MTEVSVETCFTDSKILSLCLNSWLAYQYQDPKRKKKGRIIKEACGSDSGFFSSVDIITVVCVAFFTPRPRYLTLLRRFARDIIPWTNWRKNTSHEISRKFFRDVVSLLLWKLFMIACINWSWSFIRLWSNWAFKTFL